MKILYVITSYGVGGASIQLHRMCKYLLKKNNKIVLVSMTIPESSEMIDELLNNGIKFYCMNMARGKARLRDLMHFIKIVNAENPEIINSHMVHANLLVRMAQPFLNCKRIINTVHGEEEFLGRRKFLYQITDRGTNAVVCVGKTLANQARNLKIASYAKIVTIYNGLEIAQYSVDEKAGCKLRKEYLIENSNFVWVCVGRYEKVKNHAYLIREFKYVCRTFPNTKLFIVGYGEEYGNLIDIIKEEHLTDKIILTGKRTDICNFLSMADAFVLSSLHEGLPLTLQEAGAAALPMVCTDVGGCNEIVFDNKNGYLCKRPIETNLSSYMIKLMKLDGEKRKMMGRLSKKIVDENFDINKTMCDWINLYQRLISEGRL